MLRLRQDQVRRSGGADSVRGLVIDGHVEAGARRRCGVPGSAAACCEPLKAWCLTSCPRTPAYKQKFCRWHQRCIAKFAQEILPLNLFRVATLWPKTPMASWRSSSCPQRTHHTAGNSASLYSLKYGFAGILDHGFLEAACCAGETNPRFELPNAQNWWWQISTKRRLTGCTPQRRTRSACFRVSRPRIIIPALLLSGFLEAVISFHVHVHS